MIGKEADEYLKTFILLLREQKNKLPFAEAERLVILEKTCLDCVLKHWEGKKRRYREETGQDEIDFFSEAFEKKEKIRFEETLKLFKQKAMERLRGEEKQ